MKNHYGIWLIVASAWLVASIHSEFTTVSAIRVLNDATAGGIVFG